MKTKIVKDVMRQISEYETISSEANLYEAAVALHEAHERSKKDPQQHRILLITDEQGEIVGKISQLDILRFLEPKGKPIARSRLVSRFGVSEKYLSTMLDKCKVWEKPLLDLCRDAGRLKVRRLIHKPMEGEFVEEDASLTEAVHQIALEHHQSLLVTRGKKIVGVLRQKDVFEIVYETLGVCGL